MAARGRISLRYKELDLNLLFTLHVVLERSSVRHAAERLNITQPAVSAALARLRLHFNDELLTRSGRGLVRTSRGDELLAELSSLIGQIEMVAFNVRHFDPRNSRRTFRVLTTEDFAQTVFIPFIQKVFQEAPGITFSMVFGGAQTHEIFKRGGIDLMAVPQPLGLSDAPHDVLFEEGFVCIVWDGNDAVGAQLSLDQYLASPHIVFGLRGWQNADVVTEALNRLDAAREPKLLLPSLSLTPQAVVGSPLIATVPARYAAWAAERFPLRILEAPFPIRQMARITQWNRQDERNAAVLWLRNSLSAWCDGADVDFGATDTA